MFAFAWRMYYVLACFGNRACRVLGPCCWHIFRRQSMTYILPLSYYHQNHHFSKKRFGSFCSFMGNIFWCISFFLCVPATLLLLFWGFKNFSLYFVDYSTPSPPLPCRYLPQTVVWPSGVVFFFTLQIMCVTL